MDQFPDNWGEISGRMPGRSYLQCYERWTETLNPRYVKSNWTLEEDATILEFVNKYGTKSWSLLAVMLPNRTRRMIRHRWKSKSFGTGIKQDRWSIEEDKRLFQMHREHGSHWERIAALLGGRRSPSAVSKRVQTKTFKERVMKFERERILEGEGSTNCSRDKSQELCTNDATTSVGTTAQEGLNFSLALSTLPLTAEKTEGDSGVVIPSLAAVIPTLN